MVRGNVVNVYYKDDWESRTTFLLSGFGIGWHYDVGMQAVRMMDAGVKSNKKFSDYFKENVYVNPSGMLYGEQLKYCLETFGVDHIMWGEDYPYRKKEDISSKAIWTRIV